MKFTWGTGIFLFLVIFVAAALAFVVFASRQKVNLVHKNYYEKGVDYSEQMRVDERSKPYARSLSIENEGDFLIVNIEAELAEKLDSGSFQMYRPSDSRKDIFLTVNAKTQQIQFDKNDLINGRYVLKFTWYLDGVKYEIDRPVNIQ